MWTCMGPRRTGRESSIFSPAPMWKTPRFCTTLYPPALYDVLENIPGDRIRLYALTENSCKQPLSRKQREEDAEYFIRGISYPYKKTIFAMFIQESVAKLRKKMHLA